MSKDSRVPVENRVVHVGESKEYIMLFKNQKGTLTGNKLSGWSKNNFLITGKTANIMNLSIRTGIPPE